jgi:hypothetical protein
MKKPSITQLISMLDKPALLNWANKLGLQGIDLKTRSKEIKAKGTSLHSQTNRFFTQGIPMELPKHQGMLNWFMQDKIFISSETEIETDYFTGIYDLKYSHQNKIVLADFKSSHHVYFENRLQLAGYAMAEPCDDLVVVNIPDFTIKNSGIKDRKPYEEILKRLSEIYYLKGETENGRF